MEDCVSAGEIFYVMSSEKDAKSLLSEREDFLRELLKTQKNHYLSLEEAHVHLAPKNIS